MKKRILLNMIPVVLLVLVICVSMSGKVSAEEPNPYASLLRTHKVEHTDVYDFTDKKTKSKVLKEAESFPTSFDLRDRNVVTPVKLQNPFGTCWVFAAIAAAETSLISDGLLDPKSADLSERHLGYFSCSSVQDEDSPQYGEGFKEEGVTASDILNMGGSTGFASYTMESGVGPVLERNDPELMYRGLYGNVNQRVMPDGELRDFSYSSEDEWSIPYERRNEVDFPLKESYELGAPADEDEKGNYSYNEAVTAMIKKQIMQGRAVGIAFLADTALPNQIDEETAMLSNDWAQYGRTTGIFNHAVTIVGWDDTIGAPGSSVQFKDDCNPIKDGFGPGAWLVKNSWGSGEEEFPNHGTGDWGIPNAEGKGTGYFWLSYYDHSLSGAETYAFEKNKNYTMEAHDCMIGCITEEFWAPEELKAANIFRAPKNEVIRQISFRTSHPGTSVSYQIYLMPEGDSNSKPDTGILAASGSLGPYEVGGFHREDLPSPVTVMKGQSYSIVITERRTDGEYCMLIPYDLKSDHVGVINIGESMYYYGGEWLDLGDPDVRKDLFQWGNAYDNYVYDNFPIKAYSQPMEDVDFSAQIFGDGDLYLTPKNSMTKLEARTTTYTRPLPKGIKVKWELDGIIRDMDGKIISKENLVDISGLDENGYGLKVTLKVRKDGDRYVEGYSDIYMHLIDGKTGRKYGSIAKTISVSKQSIETVRLVDQNAEFIYNGKAFKPEIEVTDFKGNIMREGVDYTKKYKDNVKVGVATIVVTPCGDYLKETETVRFFVIKPAKAVLKKITAGGKKKLKVKVKDQSKTGITGYQVQFRIKGKTKWTSKKFKTKKSTLTLKGLKPGKKYEIRVRGYWYYKKALNTWGVNSLYYGEFSKTGTSAKVKR